MTSETVTPARKIRSFVRREGRMTGAQQRALEQLWPVYGLAADRPVDPVEVFGRSAPLTLEIGFGNGATLAGLARNHPDEDFIGIEVHRPGVGRLLQSLRQDQLHNVRVLCADAVEVLENCLPDAGLQRVLLLFPDPWHKKRHHKRRIVQQPFVSLLARKLAPGGILHMATDWQDYARYMLEQVAACPAFSNCAGAGRYAQRPDYRIATRFEQRGRLLGHTVYDLLFERI